MRYTSLLVALLAGLGISCSGSEGDTLTTDSGIKYEYIKKGTGEVPPVGGYWALNVEYFKENGEKMFSSADQGGPMTMGYFADFPKNGSIEECLSIVGNGDSAVFEISADSLYKYSAGRGTPPDMVGTKIKLYVSVDDIYTSDEYVAMMEKKEKEQIAKEKSEIEKYLDDNNIAYEVTENGLYYSMIEEGSGAHPEPGQTVRVNYKGYTMDGTVFDTSIKEEAEKAGIFNPRRPYEPLEFPIGQQKVIKGWDQGIALIAEGGKAKLIVPSPLGYGTRGMGNAIGPNTILIFDVELVEVVQ